MQRRRIGSVLIANRGEIAERVIRTLRRLGIRTVAVYSYVDRDLPYVSAADSSFLLSNPQLSSASSDTYLQQEMILDIARRSHVDAIHPGTPRCTRILIRRDSCFVRSLT
jgi:acetyl/propionyl-CoA carboxylase alpha subunit